MPREPQGQAKFRREVFQAHKQHDDTNRIFLVCYLCNSKIDPATTAWEAEHVIPRYFGGQIGMPVCICCHKQKTATEDIPAISKSKRVSDKHFGIRRKQGWPKRYFAKREAAE
jgi:hypothetical protein